MKRKTSANDSEIFVLYTDNHGEHYLYKDKFDANILHRIKEYLISTYCGDDDLSEILKHVTSIEDLESTLIDFDVYGTIEKIIPR